ncbi:MAG TPA: BMP family ABC transporter substrate-binding protein, partial [Anaerolineae bacterium]|nr:BMP family ABC transporter substrate-binding protein [Anaerolineae bacterium]
MRKLFSLTMVLLIVAGFVLSACQAPAAAPTTQAPATQPTQAPAPAQPTQAPAQPAAAKLKVGLVTDVGGVNDKSFNQSAWEGVQKAAKDFGLDVKFIESKQPTDYEKNIDQFATEGYDVIITVGFLMGDATAAKAKQYPNIKFAIIDNAYFPTKDSPSCPDTVKDCYDDGGLKNVTSLMFQEDEPGFLAGVVAGGITQSGTVCTVSG